jgi:uncharacterized protein (DUF4415 family)
MQRKHELTSDELAEIARLRKLARAKAKQLIENADPNEDAAILAAAEADPDALPMTDEQLARMRPAHEVLPHLVARALRRGRPKLAAPKQQVTLRLDADVLDYFKERGSGWQTAINDTLRKVIGRRERENTRSAKRGSTVRKVS